MTAYLAIEHFGLTPPGVRMAPDCFKQVTGTAGEYQVEGANDFATLNIGGSTTTTASLIIDR